MAASHGVFAVENKPFNLQYLIDNFKLQHDGYGQSYKPDYTSNIHIAEQPEAYLITLGEYFSAELDHFFSEHKVNTTYKGTENALCIEKKDLNDAEPKLTYRDTCEFLFTLNQLINIQKAWESKTRLEQQKQTLATKSPRSMASNLLHKIPAFFSGDNRPFNLSDLIKKYNLQMLTLYNETVGKDADPEFDKPKAVTVELRKGNGQYPFPHYLLTLDDNDFLLQGFFTDHGVAKAYTGDAPPHTLVVDKDALEKLKLTSGDAKNLLTQVSNYIDEIEKLRKGTPCDLRTS